MGRAFVFAVLLSSAAPALAQQPVPPAGSATPQPTAPAAPPTSEPAEPSTPTDAVSAIVSSEFPAYDGNNDGQLDKAEFSRWMVALKDQEMKATGKTLTPEQVAAWTDGAFATADTDKSTSVSKPELISYLSGGATG